ncbi:MAG TPA: hypothetical protein VGN57_03035 [Pirellulaceae bacterium]|jgi:uncharacterized membrane protein|nr:hypothetical protein [Pirellulaceae bacterium]
MIWLDLVLRWLHILSACILVGGSFFMYFAWFPGLAQVSEAARGEALAKVRRGWAMWVGIASGLILISGFYNVAMASIRYDVGPVYNGLVALKIVLGLALMFLASVLSGRSASAERYQAKGKLWSGVAVLLSVALVVAGGAMRFQDKESRPKTRRAAVRVDEPGPELNIDLGIEGDAAEDDEPAPFDPGAEAVGEPVPSEG